MAANGQRLDGRSVGIFCADLLLATLSFPITLLLRLGVDDLIAISELAIISTGVFAAVSAIVIWRSHLDRIAWRYVSVDDAILLARTAVLINLIFLAVMFMWTRLGGVPRSALVIDVMVLTVLLLGARLLFRLWHENQFGLTPKSRNREDVQSILLIGATDEAEAFIRKVHRDPNARYDVKGIVDTTGRPAGGRIRGVKILGAADMIETILSTHASTLSGLVLADPSLRGEPVRRFLDLANSYKLKLDRLPEISFLTKASANEIDVRAVDVEDLLSRPQADLDREAVTALVSGKRVLVTGAGGSIGSELVRQIAGLQPKHIALVDSSEFNLYEIDRELSETFPDLPRSTLLLNVRDSDHVERVFEQEKPELVFHAAALKHVPMLESQPSQAVLTNVLGTRNIADAAQRHKVDAMVMISTDKATDPVNVMGVSKRIAETYCQSTDIESRANDRTRYMTVRFGNVLGSAGSVIPLFQKQLRRGGPITVTHEDMTRYFMTIREAVELVLQAATLRDESLEAGGAIVVLDMGEPVKIIDMARQMIKLAGLTPDKDIKIEITGLRPGERLYEDLFNEDEELLPTSHADMMLARPQVADRAFVEKGVETLIEAARKGDSAAVRQQMARLVPDFSSPPEVTGGTAVGTTVPTATE